MSQRLRARTWLASCALAPLVAGALVLSASGASNVAGDEFAGAATWRPQSGPSARVLQLALSAASCATRTMGVARGSLLTVIDYSLPSTQPRLWVLDLATRGVLFQELVAHGRGSGENRTERFSNRAGSYQTSLGLFRTGGTYVGGNGYSLRLQGLEPGVNDRAEERAIVMHGALYVDSKVALTLGRLGRSLGCPALRTSVARKVIDTIKDGSLVFAYYPDQAWVQASRFLGSCSASIDAPAASR